MEISIIHEDEVLLVIDKPSGVTVNTSQTTTDELTIQSWVERRFLESKEWELDENDELISKVNPLWKNDTRILKEGEYANDFYKRGGIVHRIDKETSGILLIAKTPEAFLELQKQFRERSVKKSYVALLHGRMLPMSGEINVPLGRLAWNRTKFGVIAGGRPALTRYKVLQFYMSSTRDTYSLIEAYPETGRTHQIRVHVQYLSHPIVSDMLYGGRKVARNDRKMLDRLFLHAGKITFTHPSTGKVVNYESKLPVELQEFIAVNLQKVL